MKLRRAFALRWLGDMCRKFLQVPLLNPCIAWMGGFMGWWGGRACENRGGGTPALDVIPNRADMILLDSVLACLWHAAGHSKYPVKPFGLLCLAPNATFMRLLSGINLPFVK